MADPKIRLGATPQAGATQFAVWSGAAASIDLCLFDAAGNREIARHRMERNADAVFSILVEGIGPGARYGLRADGPHDPDAGLWFDPAKLLVDPYAVEIDRPYRYDVRLSASRYGEDTAELVPKAIVPKQHTPQALRDPLGREGLIYELSVRGFTMRHPDVPPADRGTLRALAHPAVIRSLRALGVGAVQLMPVTAWIDERHLPPLGLTNAWGYNPVTFMALDPRLAPGGVADLRSAVEALHEAGIGVILDLVFNHTGESDELGPTLSLRGLDARAAFRHSTGHPARLVNDTGCGNTIACDHPRMRALILDSLRHFVEQAGVDGFRFDLGPVLGRDADGYAREAETLRAMCADPVVGSRILIAEPWDIGPGGYQLGNFPAPFLEWNDRARDDIRRFWRGDGGMLGTLATRLAGSFDIFAPTGPTRTVNFIAAHDGFPAADLVTYDHKHNEANGEANRDGHGENLSWNNGVEGETPDEAIRAARRRDLKALLATLAVTRGRIMLTAGDEFGRTQRGNNNAYAQDNETSWLDWDARDTALERFVADLLAMRRESVLSQLDALTGKPGTDGRPDVVWLRTDWQPMREADWNDLKARRLVMLLAESDGGHTAVIINGDRRAVAVEPPRRQGRHWVIALSSAEDEPDWRADGVLLAAGRSVTFLRERSIG